MERIGITIVTITIVTIGILNCVQMLAENPGYKYCFFLFLSASVNVCKLQSKWMIKACRLSAAAQQRRSQAAKQENFIL